MRAAPRGLLGVCAMLMAVAVANAASGEPVSVVVGLAKCGDCTRKNMNAEAVFKGLHVAITCKNSNGEYESKAIPKLDSSGAFRVPMAADLHSADYLVELLSAVGTPCPGQEPSRIVPMADGTFDVVAGKAGRPSADCASATMWDPFHKDHDHHHFFDHFHKKPVKPSPKPEPEYQPPTPTYISPPPIYLPPAKH